MSQHLTWLTIYKTFKSIISNLPLTSQRLRGGPWSSWVSSSSLGASCWADCCRASPATPTRTTSEGIGSGDTTAPPAECLGLDRMLLLLLITVEVLVHEKHPPGMEVDLFKDESKVSSGFSAIFLSISYFRQMEYEKNHLRERLRNEKQTHTVSWLVYDPVLEARIASCGIRQTKSSTQSWCDNWRTLLAQQLQRANSRSVFSYHPWCYQFNSWRFATKDGWRLSRAGSPTVLESINFLSFVCFWCGVGQQNV